MDELLIAGEQQETSKKNILKLITEQVGNEFLTLFVEAALSLSLSLPLCLAQLYSSLLLSFIALPQLFSCIITISAPSFCLL